MAKSDSESLLEEMGALNLDGSPADDDSGDDDSSDDADDGSNQDRIDPDEPTDDELDGPDEDEEDEDDEQEQDDREIPDELASKANRRGKQQTRGRDNRTGQYEKDGDPFHPTAKLQTDKKGAIYFNGNRVANGGEPARIFMRWRKIAKGLFDDGIAAQRNAVNVSNSARELLNRYEDLKTQRGMFDKAGLSPTEQAQMLELATTYKKDPIAGLKLMLTRAHLAGVDIKSLGVGGGVDPKALMDEMRGFMTEQLKPVITQTTQNERRDALRQQAETFFDRNPHAKDVARVLGGSHKLAQILKGAAQQSPDLSLDELFSRLHYQLLLKNGGQLPSTGPVGEHRRPSGRREERRVTKQMNNNLQRSMSSIDDIGASVLRDARALEPRGV